jgi:hypothetical protein
MASQTFFVSYEGRLTAEDREALARAGCKLYDNGEMPTANYRDEKILPAKWRQVVRVTASNSEEARSVIVEALGREPDGMKIGRA